MALTHDDIKFRLTSAVNSEVVYDNQAGQSTIGVNISFPGSGTIVFEGSFDGATWFSISLLNVVSEAYVTQTTTVGNFIGSIEALRKVRFRVSAELSDAGWITGRATDSPYVTLVRTTAL